MSTFSFLAAYYSELSEEWRNYCSLPEGISEGSLSYLLAKTEIELPPELLALYRYSYTPRFMDYVILTPEGVKERIDALKTVWSDEWNDDYIPFADLLGVGDLVVFDVGEMSEAGPLVRDGFHEFAPKDWEPICYGLREWLFRMAGSNFEPFWLKKE